jgi:hypothetical protein
LSTSATEHSLLRMVDRLFQSRKEKLKRASGWADCGDTDRVGNGLFQRSTPWGRRMLRGRCFSAAREATHGHTLNDGKGTAVSDGGGARKEGKALKGTHR